MDPNQVLAGYLSKKGHARGVASSATVGVESAADMAFRLRASVEASASHVFAHFNPDEGPASYAESYGHLKKWVLESLDIYRVRRGAGLPARSVSAGRLACC